MNHFIFNFLVLTTVVLTISFNPISSFAYSPDEENIPDGILYFGFQVNSSTVDTGFTNTNSKIDLYKLVVRRTDIVSTLSGKLTQKTSRANFIARYAYNQTDSIAIEIPYISLEQTSTLSSSLSSSDITTILNNLSSKTISGLGDIKIKATDTIYFSDDTVWRFSYGITLPTGDTTNTTGLYGFGLGEGSYDLFFSYYLSNYYHLSGLKWDFRFEALNHLNATRKTLDGVSGTYKGGNEYNLKSYLTYEISNMLFGLGYDRYVRTAMEINRTDNATIATDTAQSYGTYNIVLGFGNLTTLQSSDEINPYQFSIELKTPIESLYINTYNRKELVFRGSFYF